MCIADSFISCHRQIIKIVEPRKRTNRRKNKTLEGYDTKHQKQKISAAVSAQCRKRHDRRNSLKNNQTLKCRKKKQPEDKNLLKEDVSIEVAE